MTQISEGRTCSQQILNLFFLDKFRAQCRNALQSTLFVIFGQKLDRVIQEDCNCCLSHISVPMLQMIGHLAQDCLTHFQGHMLRRLILEQIAEAAEAEQNDWLRIFALHIPQQLVDEKGSCIGSRVRLITIRMAKVDSVEVNSGENLFNGPLHEFAQTFELLRRNFARVESFRGSKHLAHGFEVDVVLVRQSVQLCVKFENLLLGSLRFGHIVIDVLSVRNSATFGGG